MKKNVILVGLFLFVSVALFAELTDQIVIVRTSFSDSTKKTYESIADWLGNSGRNNLGESFRSHADGIFGSGSLIRSPEGKVLVLTNYHVVSQADKVVVVLSDRDDEGKELTNCKVIAADINQDLALIEIPQADVENIVPLSFNPDLVKDGLEVWSAGYPGLASAPTWQFAKGNITNQRLDRKAGLPVQGLDYIIQHSASIDGGNSGGPLLVKQGDEYQIVGINTWSANNRNNTFFAVPASYAIDFIAKFGDTVPITNDQKDVEQSLKDVNQKFLDYFAVGSKVNESNLSEIKSIIGDQLIDIKGWKSYKNYRKDLEKEEKNELDGNLIYSNTYDVMKEAVVYLLDDMAGEEGGSFESIVGSVDVDSTQVKLTIAGEEVTVTWAMKFNRWVVTDTSLLETEKVLAKEKDSKSNEKSVISKLFSGSSIAIHGGGTLGLASLINYSSKSEPDLSGYLAVDFTWTGKYIGITWLTIHYMNTKFKISGIAKPYGLSKIGFSAALRGQLPLSIANGKVYLIPFVSVGVGLQVSIDSFTFEENKDYYPVGANNLATFAAAFIPLSLGVEMTVEKLRRRFTWGLIFSGIIDLADYSGSEVNMKLSTLRFGPVVRIRW